MTGYPLTIATLLLALLIYVWAGWQVGQARGRHKIQAPAVTGHPDFERVFRAQQNTLEQLVLFLPLLLLAAMFWGDRWAGLYGLVWSIGRIVYIVTYSRDAQKRTAGFAITMLSSLIVLILLIVTLVMHVMTAHSIV